MNSIFKAKTWQELEAAIKTELIEHEQTIRTCEDPEQWILDTVWDLVPSKYLKLVSILESAPWLAVTPIHGDLGLKYPGGGEIERILENMVADIACQFALKHWNDMQPIIA